MTTKSHYQFGLYLLTMIPGYLTSAEQTAFLCGCVEPDYNPGTYLKGSIHGQKLRGHNFPNMLPCMHRLFEKIRYTQSPGILCFYRLGKLTHYLMDAFTYPHNSVFYGSLKEHIRYEASLEPLFLQSLSQHPFSWEDDGSGNPYTLFLKAHHAYLCSDMGKQRDISFTLWMVPNIIHAVSSQMLSMPVVRSEQGVLYENPAHI